MNEFHQMGLPLGSAGNGLKAHGQRTQKIGLATGTRSLYVPDNQSGSVPHYQSISKSEYRRRKTLKDASMCSSGTRCNKIFSFLGRDIPDENWRATSGK